MIRCIPRHDPRPRGALRALLLLALAASPAAAQNTHVRGTVLYEKIPVTRAGLQLDAPVRTPAAGVRVEVVQSPSRTVLGSGFTDAKGSYDIPVPRRGNPQVYVRALAQTENATVVRVRDRAELSMVSPTFALGRERTVTQDMLATDSSRIAGAFNIAVTIHHANALVRAGQPGVSLPRVEIRWDTTYIGNTYFNPREAVAFINGRRDRDSDEYDDHIIAHEYGHFLMDRFSRESSPGGDHSFGERLDPRLAWSEGWSNFFAGATTGNPRYIDTGAVRGRQIVLLSADLEDDVPAGDRPGIWSEHSVASLLWDWFDDGAEAGDDLALGFVPLWRSLVELGKEPDVYLLRYANVLAGITRRQDALAAGLDARGIRYPVGQTPAAPEPFPVPLAPGVSVTGSADSRSSLRSNVWGSSAHYWFRLAREGPVTITMKITGARVADKADLDLYLFDAAGERVAGSDAVNGVGDSEQISQRLPAGYYRVEVRSWSAPRDSQLGDGNAHQGTFSLLARY
ncbi:MAG TPA: hypothetical protein VLK84_05500 [Longimicrobium sp.]|nr:hypothetical protein [Longimicrobium sp.]